MINENRINMVSERGGKISSGYAEHKCFAIWKINPTTADPASHSHHPETCFGHGHQRGLTWYLEKIHWDQAAIGQGGTAAGMQREL